MGGLKEALAHGPVVRFAAPELAQHAGVRELFWSELSAPERERHARLRFAADADAYLVAHALVRRTLGRLLGVAGATLRLIETAHGRPELEAGGPSFNLSHTDGLVAVVVATRGVVGVDVEHVDRDVALHAVAARVFSESELRELRALPAAEQRARFFDLWTLKEAYIKAIGKGLAAPLREISFAPAQPDPVPVRFGPRVQDEPSRWRLYRLSPTPRHRLAVAFTGDASVGPRFERMTAESWLTA